MTKFTVWIIHFSSLLLLITWGCTTTAGGGAEAWIDYPLHNSSLPLAPITILAHATHEDGVSGINFYIDGEQIAAVSLGGKLLESASVEWNPPTVGSYNIEALGVDASGEPGTRAKALVNFGSDIAGTTPSPQTGETITITPSSTNITVTSTSSGTPSPTGETASITPSLTPEMPIVSEPNATANQNSNCRSGPNTIFPAVDYLLQGDRAIISGRLADNSWLFVLPSGSTEACWISSSVVSVLGDFQVVPIVTSPPPPVTDTPTNTPTTPAPDTTKPTVQSLNLNPTQIMRVMPGCPSYSRTTVSTVIAVDNVAVSYVSANWVLRDEVNIVVASGSLNYSKVNDTTFQGTFGSVSYSGTMTINGFVFDTSGNSTPFTQQITVIECIG